MSQNVDIYLKARNMKVKVCWVDGSETEIPCFSIAPPSSVTPCYLLVESGTTTYINPAEVRWLSYGFDEEPKA